MGPIAAALKSANTRYRPMNSDLLPIRPCRARLAAMFRTLATVVYAAFFFLAVGLWAAVLAHAAEDVLANAAEGAAWYDRFGEWTPAWVQAIGTLIALFIAIAVPWRIHLNESRQRKSEKRLQGQAIAILIRPILIVLRGTIERAMVAGSNGDYAAMDVEVPSSIKEQVNLLWLMGSAGGHVLTVISALDANSRLVREHIGVKNPTQSQINERLRLTLECLENARDAAVDTGAALGVLIDSID